MSTRDSILFSLIFVFCITSCVNKQIHSQSNAYFSDKLAKLKQMYHDSLQAQQGGITPDFLRRWGNRYWKLVQNHPEHELAPEAAQKGLSIYTKFDNPNIIEEKLKSISIHDRAMSGILPYWKRISDTSDSTPIHSYTQKLKYIAEHSRSEKVQIAAHYYLARWYTKFKYYEKALSQLNTLGLSYHIYPTHKKYGEQIEKMRARAANYSAGKRMPDFSIKMLQGGTFTQQALKNHVTFLYFYGSHCGSCISMYPKITKLYNQYKDKSFQVVGFGNDWRGPYGFNTPEEFKQFARNFNIAWPQAVELSLFTDTLNVQALSTGYLINGSKKIVRISRSDVVTNATKAFKNTSLKEAVKKLVGK